jgi:hypothetical protein
MDLIHCKKTFIRVAELGNFTAAAHALNANISYTSRAVSELETYLQTRLMNRTTRKMGRDCTLFLGDPLSSSLLLFPDRVHHQGSGVRGYCRRAQW